MKPLATALLVLSLLVPAFAQTSSSAAPDAQAEQEMLRLVNLARARQGLTSLRMDPDLQAAARAHSEKMAQTKQLSHQLSNEPVFTRRLSDAGAQFSAAGENVAFNQNAAAAHDDLMHSPPHRANILNRDFNAIGIGVVRQGENIWVTEDFAREFQKMSNQDARNAVFAAFQQARRAAHGPRVKLVNRPALQAAACRMAHNGHLETQSALALNGVHTATAYTEPALSKLPSNAQELANNPGVREIAIGACFASSPKYPAGMYWVVIAAY